MQHSIINRGRGPEIAGTRITVYDIWDYAKHGWHHSTIAATLRLSSAEVQTALDYIAAHQAEVMAEYEKILARSAAGNPAEVEAKMAQSRARVQAKLRELHDQKARENGHAGAAG